MFSNIAKVIKIYRTTHHAKKRSHGASPKFLKQYELFIGVWLKNSDCFAQKYKFIVCTKTPYRNMSQTIIVPLLNIYLIFLVYRLLGRWFFLLARERPRCNNSMSNL